VLTELLLVELLELLELEVLVELLLVELLELDVLGLFTREPQSATMWTSSSGTASGSACSCLSIST
jgi:hypothetical protein